MMAGSSTLEPARKALLSDEDFDHAQLQAPGKVEELVGIEAGNVAAGQPLPALPQHQYDAPMWQKTFESKIIGAAQRGVYSSSLGSSVAIDGDLMVAAAVSEIQGAGAVYVYRRNLFSGNWFVVKRLTTSDAVMNTFFGSDVAIGGNTVVVGACESAYIFDKDQGGVDNCGQVKKIVASDGAANGRFGDRVAIRGNMVVVGAYFEDHDVNGVARDEANVGVAYIFNKDQGGIDNWGQVGKLTALDGTTNDSFSEDAVAISGAVIVVGAWFDDNANGHNVGAVYIYE